MALHPSHTNKIWVRGESGRNDKFARDFEFHLMQGTEPKRRNATKRMIPLKIDLTNQQLSLGPHPSHTNVQITMDETTICPLTTLDWLRRSSSDVTHSQPVSRDGDAAA